MTLPRILYRTVPAETDAQIEAWWGASVALTPGWEHVTYRDPLDAADWPLTAPHWSRCTSGAQFAGLVRLEAAIRHGGVYADADATVVRPIDSLLSTRGFAGWEDRFTCPDAIFGFEPDHPVLPVLLADAIAHLDQGAWESGPGAFTRNLPGRDDVILFPPATLYPFHWSRKRRYDVATPQGRRAVQQVIDSSPATLMYHAWRHSWRGA